MKRYVGVGFGVVALVGALAVQSASAVTITRIPGYYSGSGGEFTVFGTGYEQYYAPEATYTDSRGTGFQTLCVEVPEKYTTSPDSYDIKDYAVKGGGGAVGGKDPLALGTAWLYLEFANGDLSGYDYTQGSGRATEAYELQMAIWWLEDEAVSDQSLNPYILLAMDGVDGSIDSNASVTAVDLKANNKGNNYEVGGVAIINFVKDGQERQSMLVLVPDGGLTLMLVGAGMLGCAALRRRFAK